MMAMSTRPERRRPARRAPRRRRAARWRGAPKTRWCQTSSMVIHEAKKLHANTSGGPLRGARALTACTTPDHAEQQEEPAHPPSLAACRQAGEVRPFCAIICSAWNDSPALDASFLYFETPSMHMHVAMTAIFDPSTMPGGYELRPDQGVHRRRGSTSCRRSGAASSRCRSACNHPLWVEDPDFDLDYHIRRIGAPSPGGHHELAEVAAQIASTPLDRSRPLWELHVVEGLADGNIRRWSSRSTTARSTASPVPSCW